MRPIHTDVAMPLRECVYEYVCDHSGVDAEDVATFFEIPDWKAVSIVGSLIEEGRLGHAEEPSQ